MSDRLSYFNLFHFIISLFFFFWVGWLVGWLLGKMRNQDPIITVKTLVTETATVDDIATTAVADRDDHKKDHYSELSQSEPHIDRCAEISNPQVPSGSVVSLAAKIKVNRCQYVLKLKRKKEKKKHSCK